MSESVFGRRLGFTLIEVILFVALFAIVASVMIPLLFTSTETRLRQQTIALVDDNGAQALQHIVRRIRNAERVLYPPQGTTGAYLALQTASGTLTPTIVAVQTGAFLLIQGATKQTLTAEKVAVVDFVVRNTSTSSTTQSVEVRFTIARTIRLQAPHTYQRPFTILSTLLPADEPAGDDCGCGNPQCTNNILTWETCQNDVCIDLTEGADCF